jgi:hypothetical protein
MVDAISDVYPAEHIAKPLSTSPSKGIAGTFLILASEIGDRATI